MMLVCDESFLSYIFVGKATHPVVPQLFFGILAASAGFLVLLLPETNNRTIPDTIQEASEIARIVQKEFPQEDRTVTKEGYHNALADVSFFVSTYMPKHHKLMLPLTASSPDLAPCDFRRSARSSDDGTGGCGKRGL
ncbi:hypothetical protein AVEN_231632-1 [Araneus ventricosus]|uniref:Uncharacterized protein n=1 Tax=Araneus ventricosus TaxID=182803 RepID=A0A4Y2K1K4_ARAVE|nr:hypothetical protein AVEN_231632-1 [Araneus ventricosus]